MDLRPFDSGPQPLERAEPGGIEPEEVDDCLIRHRNGFNAGCVVTDSLYPLRRETLGVIPAALHELPPDPFHVCGKAICGFDEKCWFFLSHLAGHANEVKLEGWLEPGKVGVRKEGTKQELIVQVRIELALHSVGHAAFPTEVQAVRQFVEDGLEECGG